MDFKDGEIRYKTIHITIAKEIGVEEIKYLVFANLATVDDHYTAIMNVVHTMMSPVTALAKIKEESKPESPDSKHHSRFEVN